MIPVALILVISYLLGSIPFGYLIGRARGIDVRKHGSGNIGATNVFRLLGRTLGTTVFFCDVGKGLAAVLIAGWVASNHPPGTAYAAFFPVSGVSLPPLVGEILAAIWCLIGHSFPIWLGFKGGKGVATTVGVMLGMLPLATAIVFLIWVAVYFSTRYVSLASLTGACALPVAVLFLSRDPERRWPLFTLSLLATFLIIWRHRANIERLIRGTEHRFDKKKKT